MKRFNSIIRSFSHQSVLRLLLFSLCISPFSACQDERAASLPDVSALVSTYSEPGIGSVNSHWITTETGIIVIDVQRSIASATKLVAQLRATGRPVLAVVISHAHPDHFGGWQALAQAFPTATFYLSQATFDAIKSDKGGYVSGSIRQFGDDFSKGAPFPARIINNGDRFDVGPVSFRVDEIGQGEAEAMTVIYSPNARLIFTTDLIQNRMTAFLLEGHSTDWLRQLDRAGSAYPATTTTYPGHGMSGPLGELITTQRDYLTTFRGLITDQLRQSNTKPLTASQKQAIVQAMQARYPGYLPVAAIPTLLEMNIDPVSQEL